MARKLLTNGKVKTLASAEDRDVIVREKDDMGSFAADDTSTEISGSEIRSVNDYLHESEDYAAYVDDVLKELERMSGDLEEDIDSLMASIGQISDVSGQGALGVEGIAKGIVDIRMKTADLEEASQKAQEKAAQLDYEISKFAVR